MIGYTALPTSDPEEAKLREQWYAMKARKEAGEEGAASDFDIIDRRLCKYLWDRCEADIAADRKKHPRAKRNQTFEGPAGIGRALP